MGHALEELQGVRSATASHAEKMAVVIYDERIISVEEMCQALLAVGYVATAKAAEMTTPNASLDELIGVGDRQMGDLICYCFEYSREDVEQDFHKHGQSLIMERITREKKLGGCDCARKNPKRR